MPSTIPGFEYDIFISYRHNDNLDGWVTDFVQNLEKELKSTLKEPVSIYFDSNPHDGLLETHNVDKSLEGKLKCLIFIPILSQTYCDPKSFAWQHEFVAFNKLAEEDQLGRDIKLSNGNVASRILPVKIHDLDAEDKAIIENEIGGELRAIEFIYKEPGVNRPLSVDDSEVKNINKTKYKNQINKVANAIKEIISALKNPVLTKPIAERVQPTPKQSNRKIIAFTFLAIALLSVAGYFLYPKLFPGTRADLVVDKSIAVLPFEDFIEDDNMKYFADGLTEEILNVLAKTPDLKVASRTSSFQYKNKDEDARKIASELGVAHILEGSVRGNGEKLRITAQLIRASDGFHLWSETYDRTKEDIIEIQEDIALKIAQALQTAMDPKALEEMIKSGTHSVEAYSYYLKGLSLNRIYGAMNQLSPVESYENFEKARALDQTFVSAHYRAAMFWNNQLLLTAQVSGKTTKSYNEKLDLYNERNNLAIRYASPIDQLKYQGNQAFIQLQFRKAISILNGYILERPNDLEALLSLTKLAAYLGEYDMGKEYVNKMEANALHNAGDMRSVINARYLAKDYEVGAKYAQKAIQEFPYDVGLLYQAHRIFLWNGMVKEAHELAPRITGLSPLLMSTARLRQACAEGDAALASTIYNTELKDLKDYEFPKYLGLMLLNRRTEATQMLMPLHDRDELYSLCSWLSYPYFDISSFPKLQVILEREKAKRGKPVEIPFALKPEIEK